MACTITSGINRNCVFGFGGLKKIYIANKSDVTAVSHDVDGQVTGITMETGSAFYVFEFEPENASFTEEFQGDAISKYFVQSVNMTLANMEQADKEVLEDLSLSQVVVIVQKQDESYWLLGEKGNGLKSSSVNTNSGAADGDNNIVEVILSGGNAGMADTVDSSIIDGLLTPAA